MLARQGLIRDMAGKEEDPDRPDQFKAVDTPD